MRLYGGHLIRNLITKKNDLRTEMRDAQVYDIDPVNHTCRVKIQGTSILVVAHYPENWESTPQYLKVGNAVLITHVGGNHGRIEIAGHGILIPSPITGDIGDGVITPTDKVLTGLTLAVTTTGTGVVVMAGTFELAGVIYTVPAIDMTGYGVYPTPPYVNRDHIAAVFDVGNGGAYRYDSFFVGANLTIDKVNGSQATPPLFPTAPGNHLLLGWLFRTASNIINQANVNKYYTVSVVSQITMTIADDELTVGQLSTSITINILDQYGNGVSNSNGWTVVLSFSIGNGTLSFGGESSTSSVTGTTTGSSLSFTYTRFNDETDSSPAITASLSNYGFSKSGIIILYAADGAPM